MKRHFLALAIYFLSFNSLFALIEVDITRGNLNPLPIAVSPLFSDDKSNTELKNKIKIENLGEKIAEVVENNLRTTGLFNPLEKKSLFAKTGYCTFKTKIRRLVINKVTSLDHWTGKI